MIDSATSPISPTARTHDVFEGAFADWEKICGRALANDFHSYHPHGCSDDIARRSV
jgi:hypothetical protein